MTDIDVEAERVRFEAWAQDRELNLRRTAGRSIIDYYSTFTECAWLAWKAAKRDAANGIGVYRRDAEYWWQIEDFLGINAGSCATDAIAVIKEMIARSKQTEGEA